jgi:CheY-like chemotaxis protein
LTARVSLELSIVSAAAAPQRASATPLAAVAPKFSAVANGTPRPARTGIRALVADDNPINQMVLQSQLDALGCEVDLAANGEEALTLWRSQSYTLAFCDCQMPVLDGYGFTRAVRAAEAEDPRLRRLPIVACTANAMVEEAEVCLNAGMDAYLSKPTTLADLSRVLDSYG